MLFATGTDQKAGNVDWENGTTSRRKAVVDFFDKVNNVDMDHMAKITMIKLLCQSLMKFVHRQVEIQASL